MPMGVIANVTALNRNDTATRQNSGGCHAGGSSEVIGKSNFLEFPVKDVRGVSKISL